MNTVSPPAAPPADAGRAARPSVGDVLLAGSLWSFSMFFLLAAQVAGGLAGFVLVLTGTVMCAALAWRRVRPLASAAVVVGAAALQMLTPGTSIVFADAVVLVSVYSVTAHGPDRTRVWALVVGAGGNLVAVARYLLLDSLRYGSGAVTNIDGSVTSVSQGLGSALGELFFISVFAVLLVLVAWGAGLLRRGRLARAEALRERARFVEAGREQQLRLAAQAERARIARDLHDVVAHSLAVMITQADGGRYAARTNPDAAVASLETIAETGRTALAEMRRLLGVLRDETPAPHATTPQPGLDDLDSLVEGLRSGGLAVTLESQGQPVPLPQGMGVAAYRIVQEGLTNVLKHAGPEATARVFVWWSPSALTVDVVDDGRGAGALSMPDGQGHGLLGMRERAAVYGGSVQAGPMPGGGFGVRAVFPLAVAPVRGVA